MPPKSQIPAAAKPKFGAHFVAWNSSSTGHQRAENKLSGSTGWRQSRSMKLSYQYKSGGTGGKRISDTIGAGSKDWDEKAKALIPRDVREIAKFSVEDMVVEQRLTQGDVISEQERANKRVLPMSEEEILMEKRRMEDEKQESERETARREKGIFDGLVIYINGSTLPLISDHKLKQILAENGAKISIALGRRQVTHVIIGHPCGNHSGAGGGLAGGKLEKEIKRVGGCGVKYIGVEWVLESIKAGKRLSETQFTNLKVATKRQQSVYGMFKKSGSTGSRGTNGAS